MDEKIASIGSRQKGLFDVQGPVRPDQRNGADSPRQTAPLISSEFRSPVLKPNLIGQARKKNLFKDRDTRVFRTVVQTASRES